MRVNDDKQR